MRFAASILFMVALAVSAFGQASTSVQTVNTIAELMARTGSVGETVAVRNYSTNVAWPSPRMFRQYSTSVITNAHDGVHYITNARPESVYVSFDRYAGEQDASWWGAAGDVVTDDTAALNAAAAYSARYIDESAYTTLKGPGRGFLRIRPTPTGYLITNTVNIRASVEASGAALVYRGPTNVAYNALLVAPANPTSTFINNHTFNLPDVWGWDRGFDHTNSVGIRVQGIGRSTIKFPYVYRFWKGVEFLCDTEAVTLCTFNDGFIDTCRISVSSVLTNNGYFNGNTWYGMRVNNENPNFKPGTAEGYEVIRLESFGGSLNGNTWAGGSWEGFPGQRVIYIRNGSANIFRDMRLEHHVSDYTNVVANSLYMEVESNLPAVGVDNRVQNPNQGVNGMVGIRVRETGLAIGNMGASSQFTELRTRDNGYHHGPLVFTPSAGSSGQAMMSVYPEFSWPSNHWVNFDQWLMKMTAGGWIYKAQTDPGFRLWIEPNGNTTWATGGSNYVPQLTIMSGQIVGYDDTPVQRIALDRYGSLRFYAPTTGASAGTINPYFGSTFGGMRLADIPTNQLAGFTTIQTLAAVTNNQAQYAFPGLDWIAGTAGTSDYVYVSQGIYGPIHPHGYVQNRIGLYADVSSSNAFGGSGYTIALPKTWMDFDVRLGATTSPTFKLDQSTTSGETRLLIWDGATGSARRVKTGGGVLHFQEMLTPGYVLTAISTNEFSWQAPIGSGSATNGTAMTVDSGSFQTVINVADSATIGATLTGTNLSFSANSDSIGTNHITAATEAYFLNRAVHTGTQLLSTISDAGTAASRNVPASGDAATNQVVLGSDTRLTDARTPVSHNHAASDVTSGVFSTARLGTGTPNGSNFLRGDGAWAQVSTNDIPGLVAALAAGGGGGGGTTNLVSTTTNGLVPAITASNAVFAASSTGTPEWIPRHTRTLASFRSYQGEPPSANWARMSTRNSIGTMLFDHTTEQSLRFRWLVPENFPSTQTNVTVILQWTTSATSGVARWGAQNMDLQGDIDSDSFDTAVEGNTTTSSTAGTVMVTTLSSVSLDGAVAGDWVWTRVYRDSSDAADTINSNDLELHAVEVRW